jgi:hypothetical protein
MPEPLSLVPSRVGPAETYVVNAAIARTPVSFVGDKGAAPANASLRVTNLEDTSLPVVTTTRGDGSFTVSVGVDRGDELRFVAVLDDRRLAPVDVRVGQQYSFAPVDRPACVQLDPGYALDFGKGGATRSVVVENACEDAVTLSSPRLRLALPEFTIPSDLPVTLEPGEKATLAIQFTVDAAVSAQPKEREDVLFVDVTEQGTTTRYPVTLDGEAP